MIGLILAYALVILLEVWFVGWWWYLIGVLASALLCTGLYVWLTREDKSQKVVKILDAIGVVSLMSWLTICCIICVSIFIYIMDHNYKNDL